MGKSSSSFKPGQSGNPGGRTPKNHELEELIQTALESVDDGSESGNKAIDRLVEIMEIGKPRDSIAAAKLVMAYAYGNPTQQVSMTHAIETHEQWREKIEEWKRAKKKRRPTGKR